MNSVAKHCSKSTHSCDKDVEIIQYSFDVSIPYSNSASLCLYDRPQAWPTARKCLVLLSPIFAALLAAYSAGAYAMTYTTLLQEWQLSAVQFNAGITVFVLGFGFAPVIFALISEQHGRYWVFIGAGVVFFLGTMGCALASSFGGMMVARFVTGCGASIFATLTGAVIGDLFDTESRNTAMATYSAAVIAGTGIGPLVSGLIIARLGWRWVFYLQMIPIGVTTLGLAAGFRETRENVLLKRNCQLLNKWTGDADRLYGLRIPDSDHRLANEDKNPESNVPHRKVRYQLPVASAELPINPGSSLLQSISHAFAFPIKLLSTEPIVFFFSVWVSFAWAILYMQFSSIPLIYGKDDVGIYKFSPAQTGLVYIAVIVGAVIGGILSVMQEKISERYKHNAKLHPEGRLHFVCYTSLLLPIGLTWMGLSSRSNVHWIVPTIAIAITTVGIFMIYQAVFMYFADTYQQYASSAQAAQSMCRNIFSGVFPLFAAAIFHRLGFGGAGLLLGSFGLILTLVPWLLYVYGARARARSPFAHSLSHE